MTLYFGREPVTPVAPGWNGWITCLDTKSKRVRYWAAQLERESWPQR